MFNKSVAKKEQVKLMIGLNGPSGSGKTLSALKLAYGITGDWSKIAVADTENRSSLYYAGKRTGEWEHIDFPPSMPNGYHPNNWVKLIEYVESDPKIEVLVLDSITHEWEASGGALDCHQKFGGKYQDWAKVTPLHRAFVDKMRYSRLHIIATMRVKTDVVMTENNKGRMGLKKMGLKAVQRDGLEYEFGILFDIDLESHLATSSKDRTGLFSEKPPFLIDENTGKELLTWAKEGEKTDHSPKEIETFKREIHGDTPKMKDYVSKNFMSDKDKEEFFRRLEGKPLTVGQMTTIKAEMMDEQASNVFA